MSKEIQKLIFLLFSFIFFCSLFTIHCSLSYAEGLSDIKIDALRAPVKSTDSRWGKDPFVRYEDRVLRKERPLEEELPLDLKVDGIISDGKKALAIINGGFYRRHERVNNFLIIDIKKDCILLEKNGTKLSLGIKKFVIESARRGGKK